MGIKAAYSTKHMAKEAIVGIKNRFAGIHPKMVVFLHLPYLISKASLKG